MRIHFEGVFVANADGSLVVASSQYISSEFDQLNKASWLIMSFALGVCASQPLVSSLSIQKPPVANFCLLSVW